MRSDDRVKHVKLAEEAYIPGSSKDREHGATKRERAKERGGGKEAGGKVSFSKEGLKEAQN